MQLMQLDPECYHLNLTSCMLRLYATYPAHYYPADFIKVALAIEMNYWVKNHVRVSYPEIEDHNDIILTKKDENGELVGVKIVYPYQFNLMIAKDPCPDLLVIYEYRINKKDIPEDFFITYPDNNKCIVRDLLDCNYLRRLYETLS